MKITDITTHVLLDPGVTVGATSSAQDDLVVEIHTDEGLTGLGEADVNPWLGREAIQAPSTHSMGRSLRDVLIGADPFDIVGLWQKMYEASCMNGRRGAVIHAMGAIDIALHDLRARAAGTPVWQQLGPLAQNKVRPYASLQPEVATVDAYIGAITEQALWVQETGYTAAKLSLTFSGPYGHMGLQEPHSQMTNALAQVRNAVGDDFVLMVDVQYAFADADTCLSTLRDWVDLNPYFVETPLRVDDINGLRRVSTEQPIPIAAGEWLSTRHDFEQLINDAQITIPQPDIGRVGGLTEALRVAEIARSADRRLVPHLWKTGISIAAALHFAAVTPECDFIEFTPSELADSALRRELLSIEPTLEGGYLTVPRAPGLGVELDREALAFFAKHADRARRTSGAA